MKRTIIICLLSAFSSIVYAQMYSPIMADSIYTFKDKRDGTKYNAVQIGDIVWMGENLKFKTKDSWCYDNKDFSCNKFGRLYSWDEANVVCPDGWRLPTVEEWQELVEITGGEKKAGYALVFDNGLGLKMEFGYPPNVNGRFGTEGSQTNFWTATENNDETAYSYYLIRNKLPLVFNGYLSKKYNLACRCVKDAAE